ncbi:KilA-N domain-containing protein [Megavirus baoshan]|uniref:KilA-N domain-containing protein n=1 Tax=Megavirus baoshan TaxID=2496520 RepID=A0A3S8UXS7_9VIRU|nr:KilA-N domain-containing protein [Megavirus baoshan]AZL89612.1 KilA-N domain-containing protein [Megavirus baoshan]
MNKIHNKIYPKDDIRNIIAENINDRYGYGTLSSHKVVLMKENGYVNISNILQKNKKNFNDWLKESKELIDEVEKTYGIPKNKQYFNIFDKNKDINGLYIYPNLAILIIMWCNSKFAISVSKIINC